MRSPSRPPLVRARGGARAPTTLPRKRRLRVLASLPMLDHVSLGVRDLARSIRFYDAVLAAIGKVRVWTYDHGAGYGDAGGEDRLAIFSKPETHAAGAGFHLALTAGSTAEVDAFHAAALAQGGSDLGAPGPRPRYGPGYYAAFVHDPDGDKLEVVHHGS